MSVDKQTVRRIAKLARIALLEEGVEPMMAELNAILGWVEQLQEVNVEGVEPMTSVVAQPSHFIAPRTRNSRRERSMRLQA